MNDDEIISMNPETALARIKDLREKHRRLWVALDSLLRLAIRCGLCPVGERRCEMDMAREALGQEVQS